MVVRLHFWIQHTLDGACLRLLMALLLRLSIHNLLLIILQSFEPLTQYIPVLHLLQDVLLTELPL